MKNTDFNSNGSKTLALVVIGLSIFTPWPGQVGAQSESSDPWIATLPMDYSGQTAVALTGHSDSVGDLSDCRRRMHVFSRELGDLMLAMDRLPPRLQELGWDAASEIASISDPELAAACDILLLNPDLSSHLNSVAADFEARSNGRAQGCIGVETYVAILAVKAVIDAIQVALQSVCDAASCPITAPPVVQPRLCGVLCQLAGIFVVPSETISTRMDVADNCAGTEHGESMDGMRTVVSATIPLLGSSALSTFEFINGFVDKSASDADLRSTDDAIIAGFDGESGRSISAIGPALVDLSGAVDDSRAVQVAFERESLRNRLEFALGTGVTYSRMLRPRVHGGVLEEVRELTAQRIQAFSAAGGNVDAALLSFRDGDDAFNDNDYLQALRGYREAYLALGAGVKSNGAADNE